MCRNTSQTSRYLFANYFVVFLLVIFSDSLSRANARHKLRILGAVSEQAREEASERQADNLNSFRGARRCLRFVEAPAALLKLLSEREREAFLSRARRATRAERHTEGLLRRRIINRSLQ